MTTATEAETSAAERALAGIALTWPEVVPGLPTLERRDFLDPGLGHVWAAILGMVEAGETVEPIAVLGKLGRYAEPIGGLAGLSSLAMAATTSTNAAHYAVMVREHAKRRRLMLDLSNTIDALKAGHKRDVIEPRIESALEHYRGDSAGAGEVEMWSPEDALADLRRNARLPVAGLGFPLLDDALGGGIVAGQVAVLGGGTGQGKSAFAMQIAAMHAERDGAAIVVSYELAPRLLIARVASQRLGVSWRDVVQGRFDDHELMRAIPAGLRIANRPTLGQLERMVKRECDRAGRPILIIVDYLQLMAEQTMADSGMTDARLATTQASNMLRALADSTGAPMIAISSVSRGGHVRLREARKLPPGDLVDVAKESGALEYNASAVIALSLHADDDIDGRRIATVTLAKSRFGRERHFDFRFAGAPGIWTELGDAVAERDIELHEAIIEAVASAGPLNKSKLCAAIEFKAGKQRKMNAIDALARMGEIELFQGIYRIPGGQS